MNAVMTYREAREWLANVSKKGNMLGLERMTGLMHELGDPQRELRFIHIAGTNGKGSVQTYLEHTLALSGFKTGRYLSPALFSYEETIRVEEKEIARADIARLAGIVREGCRRMEEAGQEAPTIFEVETAMAFLHFAECKCDIVLLETGMGGLTDATNVAEHTLLEIFSSISLDHMEFLGDTVEKIARVKAGIMKAGSRAVSSPQCPGAEAVLREEAARMGIPISFVRTDRLRNVRCHLTGADFSYREFTDMTIRMAGTWQIENACTALEAVAALREAGLQIPETAVRRGFLEARIPGRFEVAQENPTVILDGAHNPQAALRLRESLLAYFEGKKRLVFIMGVFADKDYAQEIALTAPLADMIYTVQTRDNPRALSARSLRDAIAGVNPNVVCAGEVEEALRMALDEADSQTVIVCFGSLSWLAQAREYLEKTNTVGAGPGIHASERV